jgi:hypothetical protein
LERGGAPHELDMYCFEYTSFDEYDQIK